MAKPTPQWHSPTRQTPIRFHFSAPSASSRSSNSPRNSSIRNSPYSSHLSSPSPDSPDHDRRLSTNSTSTTTSSTSSSSATSTAKQQQQQQLFTHIRHKFQQGLHTLEDLQVFLEVTIKSTCPPPPCSTNKPSPSSTLHLSGNGAKQSHRTATADALRPHQPSVRNLLSNMIIMAKWLVEYLHTAEREDAFGGGGGFPADDSAGTFPPRSSSTAAAVQSPYSSASSSPDRPTRLSSPRKTARAGACGGSAAARAHAAAVQELRSELHCYSWRVMRITTILKEWL
ncbi:uncharacterized protein K489DRAFT_61550 [Dissoconium aciculare CBS 342.82]|uniref:Uncharacterized protein n=1 Tax=Dissoconium aciculare CBS 342.82 TaxID=1314786 RepID=A0A6J3LW57_9PEZI|nr:uncharacterized protein K489DRAFT_61550 [Dissoconium aciculare CBS 342.82]KAF1819903.1 hypothetical protein K489DRAFT_61550 [Dissoconium aciculare CBS 342.82]